MVFVKVAQTKDVDSGKMIMVEIKGEKILIAGHKGNYYAIEGLCSHKMGILADGMLNGKIVTCPLHQSEFDLTSGKVVNVPFDQDVEGEVRDQKKYEVKVENGNIFVNI